MKLTAVVDTSSFPKKKKREMKQSARMDFFRIKEWDPKLLGIRLFFLTKLLLEADERRKRMLQIVREMLMRNQEEVEL